MKVLIIDDDQASIEALSRLLSQYDHIELTATANKGTTGIALVKQHQPDLLFLDVEMPDMSGLEFLTQMRHFARKDCKVVIYTAHSRYMLPAFRGKAFDFLLKPVDAQELQKIMQRFLIEHDEQPSRPVVAEKTDGDKLLLYMNMADFRVVNIHDVGLFQYNHELRAWEALVAGRQEMIRLKRTASNELLQSIDPRFVQVSQRHIINIDYLMEVTDSICHFYPPFDHFNQVKVGRTFRKQLTDRFSAL